MTRCSASVAGGIARYLNADVTLVRVITAALALFTGAGLALYLGRSPVDLRSGVV